MPSDTASTSSRLTIPISPTFSADNTNSAPHSEATSDEQPDLGQFTQILWAWNNLQPAPRFPNTQFHPPPSSQTYRNAQTSISSFTHPGLSEASGTESLGPEESAETVWAQHQLQSYFSLNSITPSTEVHELDENEYDINIANHTYPDEGYEEAPPFSPTSDGSQTVEICEATSDFDNPDSSFLHDSDRSPAGRPMASSVMGSSSSREGNRWMAAGSGAGGHSSLTSRGELALRHPSHLNHSFNRHSRQGSSEGVPVHITPRQADFPIHDQSSVYSQSTARTVGTRTLALLQAEYEQHSGRREDVLVDDNSSVNSYPSQADSESAVQSLLSKARVARSLLNDNSTTQSADASDSSSSGTKDYSPVSSQPTRYYRRELDPAVQATPPRAIRIRTFSPEMEPPSPLPTPQDSEVLLYSPQRQHLMVGEMDEDYSLTPTRAPVRTYGHLLPQHIAESDQYPVEGVAHAYPHPLKGHHVLPATMTATDREGDLPSKGAHDVLLPVRSAHDVVNEHCEDDLDHDQPSLGLLDEALGFIAAERAKYEALRASGAHLGDGGPTLPEWRHVVDSSNAKRKRRKKKGPAVDALDDSSLQMSRTSSIKSTTRPLLLAADPDNALPESDHDAVEAMKTNLLRPTNDKRLMILTRPKPLVSTISAPGRVEDEPLRLIGKKGRRVGRKEREREKAKRDKERAALEAADPERTTRGNGGDDGIGDEDDKGEEEVDLADEDGEGDGDGEEDMEFSSSGGSVLNINALRASAGSRAYIHEIGPGKGVYKSTPATPRAVTPTDFNVPESDKGDGAAEGREEVREEPLVIIPPVKVGRSRKKSRKRPKTLEHSKSYPNLRQDVSLDSEEHDAVSVALPSMDQTKRSRLIDLADRLESIFPEDHKDLKKVIQRLESVSRGKTGLTRKGSVGGGRGKAKHSRNGSEGAIPTPNSSTDADALDPIELEVIGRTPAAGNAEPLIHVFIDHSNILIGLLNFLKRHPPPKPVVSEYLSSRLVKPPLSLDKVSTPIEIPVSNKRATAPLIGESPADSQFAYPIALPSFATAKGKDTVSMSLPSDSALDAHMSKRQKKNNGIISYASEEQDRDDDASGGSSSNVEKKAVRFPRHLWHAALVLVLERGRAISRRVVVTSSPLYQPMESIQNLGYEVRIYMRVPNLGDGMDQERKKARYSSSRSIYAAKGATSKKTHMRHISGSTSADSGSAGAIAQAHSSGAVVQSAAASSAVISKIKYREQGVDELLQLKLHQAIADVDTVPSNSTIVLATGDGNVGQFNEDGFLGPVRTALKRGWKVELYAWEDGLSRSWRREFGENSEWGKKGLFRIIPLEQFATSLVEAAGW